MTVITQVAPAASGDVQESEAMVTSLVAAPAAGATIGAATATGRVLVGLLPQGNIHVNADILAGHPQRRRLHREWPGGRFIRAASPKTAPTPPSQCWTNVTSRRLRVPLNVDVLDIEVTRHDIAVQ